MNRASAKTIREAIARFDEAAQEYAFRGSFSPASKAYAEEEYESAKKALFKAVGVAPCQ